MAKQKNVRFLTILAIVLLAFIVSIPLFKFAGPEVVYQISKTDIRHDQGCSYISNANWRSPGYPITLFVSDNPHSNEASRLLLFEDGKLIGSPHSLHENIRKTGGGRYSHWDGTLYFSTPDCANPIGNGKTYSISIPLTLHKAIYFLWLGCLFALGVIAVNLSKNYSWIRVFFDSSKRLYQSAFIPIYLSERSWSALALGSLIFSSFTIFLITTWITGRSISLGVAGYFQVSDSLAYWTCSNSLLDLGDFGNTTSFTKEWCQRRAIYPTFLSGISLIAERNIYGSLFLQATILSLSVFVLLRRCSSYIGLAGVFVCYLLLFRYASVDLLTLTMTENAGLIFSCVGFAILIRSIETSSLPLQAFGIAFISIALNARAGAFLILPFLVLWSGISAKLLNKSILKWVAVSLMAVLVGFLLQSLLVFAVGGNPGNSNGNFSYTLYGLSVGGKGWQQVLTDHPEISGSDAAMSRQIYALALSNIINQPGHLLTGLSHNISIYLSSGAYGFEKLGALGLPVKIIWWLSWIPVLTRIKQPFYLLVALASVGVIVSAPIIIGDGGARVFAATVPIDVIQVGIGIFWLGTMFVKDAFTARVKGNIENRIARLSLEGSLGFGLLLIVFIPFFPLKKINSNTIDHVEKCGNEEYTVLTSIGKNSTMVLDFIDENKQIEPLRGEVSEKNIRRGLPISAWYYDQVVQFKGKSLIAAYQFDAADSNAPGPYLISSESNLSSKYYGRMVRLCVDKNKHEIIFDTPYRQLNSITTLD